MQLGDALSSDLEMLKYSGHRDSFNVSNIEARLGRDLHKSITHLDCKFVRKLKYNIALLFLCLLKCTAVFAAHVAFSSS